MMGFIDHKNVPAGGQSLFDPTLAGSEKIDAAQHELTFQEWIVPGIGGFDRLASLLVEDVEPEIKTAQQFDEPLMNQRVRNEDQHALGAAGQEQPMKDQACFDGFSQADFVRQQNPWQQTPRNHRS